MTKISLSLLPRYRLSAAVGLAYVLWLIAAPPADARVEKIGIAYYPGYSLSLAQAEELLRQINVLVETHGFGNQRCVGLKYELHGTPSEYAPSLPKDVSSESQMLAFGRNPHTVHIVRSIQWCPGATNTSRIVGCALNAGPIFIAKKSGPANLFLHEVGHGHWLAHHGSFHNIMYKAALESSVGKKDWQCNSLDHTAVARLAAKSSEKRGEPPVQTPPETGTTPEMEGEEVEAEPIPFEELVTGIWPHGLPVSEVEKLTEEQVSQVRNWLSGAEYKYWPNSVIILGLRGNESDLPLLETILNTKSEDENARDAKLNVPRALAYLAYRTKSNAPVEKLQKLLSPQANTKLMSRSAEDSRGDDAVILSLEATRAMAIVAASGKGSARSAIEAQSRRQKSGAVELGVDESFFDLVRKLQDSVEKKGLLETLREEQR